MHAAVPPLPQRMVTLSASCMYCTVLWCAGASLYVDSCKPASYLLPTLKETVCEDSVIVQNSFEHEKFSTTQSLNFPLKCFTSDCVFLIEILYLCLFCDIMQLEGHMTK